LKVLFGVFASTHGAGPRLIVTLAELPGRECLSVDLIGLMIKSALSLLSYFDFKNVLNDICFE